MASPENSVKKIVEKYTRRLIDNKIDVQKVLLFGSYAKGRQTKDSDIDVAIVSTSFKGDRFADRKLVVPFRRGLDSRIEPMPFTPSDFEKGGILIDEIKKTGFIIRV